MKSKWLYNGSLAEIQKVVPNGLKLGHKQETTMVGIIKVFLKNLQARKSNVTTTGRCNATATSM